MKSTKIISGNFAGEGSQGNFTAYNGKGEKIFVHKNMLANLGIKTDADFKAAKELWAVVGEREIATRDENGELTTVMTKRLQALSLFKTQAEVIAAFNEDAVLELQAKKALSVEATAAGLSQKAVDALLAASI